MYPKASIRISRTSQYNIARHLRIYVYVVPEQLLRRESYTYATYEEAQLPEYSIANFEVLWILDPIAVQRTNIRMWFR